MRAVGGNGVHHTSTLKLAHCVNKGKHKMSTHVYIVSSKPYGTLYTGTARDLLKRIYQHREEVIDEFTKKYGVKRLVYYEEHAEHMKAVQREKNIKHWLRQWKIELIESVNPEWKDLWNEITAAENEYAFENKRFN